MGDKKRRQLVYTWEDVGGTTPSIPDNITQAPYAPGVTPSYFQTRPQTLSEMFPDVLSPIKGFAENQPYMDTAGNIRTAGEPNASDLTYGQRASNFITNQLLKFNLHNAPIGGVAQEIGTPIISGFMRAGESAQKNDIAGETLGVAGSLFGTLMSPFTAIKMGAETVGGKTVGEVAEVGSLAMGGGLPLVVGYFTSQGASKLAEKISQGLDLTPKEQETVQEVTGLISFALGTKGSEAFGKKINTELGKKVNTWLDQALPDNLSMSQGLFRAGEKPINVEGTTKDLTKSWEQQRVINNPPEKKPYEPSGIAGVPTKIITSEGTPSEAIFSKDQIRERIKKIDENLRQAEKEGNEALYNQLEQEKKRWTTKLGEQNATKEGQVKENNQLEHSGTDKSGQTEKTSSSDSLFPSREIPQEKVNKREQKRQQLLDENTKAVNDILNEDPSLSGSPRQISKKLSSLQEQGKLSGKVSIETIKQISEEWNKNRPKPKTQKIKATPNELGLKIPNEDNSKYVIKYDKNTGTTLKEYLDKYPEVLDKVKDLTDFEQVRDVIIKDNNTRRSGNQPAKDLLNKVSEGKIPDSMWDDIFGKPQTREEILRDLDKAKREGLGNVGSVLGAVNVDIIKGYAKLGALHIKEGARDFSTWSKKMIDDLGDEIKPYLRELYTGIQQNSKIDDKPIIKYIEEHKKEFNLETKKTEGKIIDPNSGQEGAARHKAGKEKSTIEYNDNTQGTTWYHEFAHVVNNYLRQQNPNFLREFVPEIDKLVPDSKNKPLNEKFADAFTRIYTDPTAPRTRLGNVLESLKIPKSFELARRTNKELGFEPLPQRESGIREEKSLEWLDKKYDAPTETVNEIKNARDTELYKELRDDGTQTFDEAVKESARLQDITEEKLLNLDPKTLNGKVFNKAQQVKIDQIAINKALQVGELRKTFGEKLGTDQAKILEKEILNLVKLQALAKNNLREAARVMESARKRNRLSPEEYELIDKIAGEIDKANKNTNLAERVKGIEEATNPSLKDKAMYWWYNGILSNPLTDVANIGGNLTNLTWEVVTQPQVIIDGSLFKGIKLGWENAKRVWDGQQQAISKYTDLSGKYSEILKTKTKTGTRIKNTLLPTERLKIEDAFFRSIFENIREQRQAKLTAKELNVKADDIIKAYNEILEGKDIFTSDLILENGLERFQKEVDAIEKYANKMVFQEELGGAGRSFQRGLNYPVMLPVKMLALPFLRIAVNLTKISLESSPAGFLKPLLKRAEYKDLTKLEKQDIYRRAMAGTMILGGLASLVSTGKVEITGEAPSDPRIRELWEKAGYRVNSIVINNEDGTKTLIAYPNVSPFNITLGAVGTLMTEAKYSKPKEDVGDWVDLATDKVLNSALSMVRVLGNQSFLQGTSRLLTTIETGDAKNIKQQIVRMATPNIFSLFQGSADFGEGRVVYNTEGILDQVKERLGITGDLTPELDAYGEDRLSTYRRFPIPHQEKVDKIADLLLKTGNVIGTPSNPKIQGKEVFDKDQYNSFIKEYKQNMYKALNRTYDLLERLQNQGEVGSMTLDRLVSAIKTESRELAKIKVKENQ